VSEALWVSACGTVRYETAREVQKALEEARLDGRAPDTLLLLEHPPTLTQGRRADAAEIPMGADWYAMQGIEVCETDRGGRVTYHGPGQLVAYPIVDLGNYGDDVVAYVRRLERVIIETLAAHGVGAGVIAGLTGVWTRGGEEPPAGATADSVAAEVARGEVRKIASIGIHVRRGITTHGLAINVVNDLQPFEWIVPCGIDGCRMTSVVREAGPETDPGAVAGTLEERFAEVFGRTAERVTPEELGRRIPGAAALRPDAAGALP
jgi:lipoyl(octanoyl) transferase